MTKDQMLAEAKRLWDLAKSMKADTKLSCDCKFRLLKRAHALAAQANSR